MPNRKESRFEKPVYDLAVEIAQVINKAMDADKNQDGKIKGSGEITAMIFMAISEIPGFVMDVNTTIAYYRNDTSLKTQDVMKDVLSAIKVALGELELKDKTWVLPVQVTIDAMISILDASSQWITYSKIEESKVREQSLLAAKRFRRK